MVGGSYQLSGLHLTGHLGGCDPPSVDDIGRNHRGRGFDDYNLAHFGDAIGTGSDDMKITISDDFRASMNWLHTWAGVAVSCFLFMVFWMGSLAVYDREIDQWMKPELRAEASQSEFSYEAVVKDLKAGGAEDASRIFISAPSERDPLISAG